MLKVAAVKLVMSRTICSGEFMVLVAGEQAEVEASLAEGLLVAKECAIDHVMIPNVHRDVYPALSSTNLIRNRAAWTEVAASASLPNVPAAMRALRRAVRALEDPHGASRRTIL